MFATFVSVTRNRIFVKRWKGIDMYDVIGEYHFHRDCIHYDSVIKEPRPERSHKGRQFIKCMDCGYGMHYYCDSDFENIKTQCRYFEPKEPSLFDLIKSADGNAE